MIKAPTAKRLRTLRWYEWGVVRQAITSVLIVVAGYIAAAVLSVESIDTLVRTLHDDEVASSLELGLSQIKENHALRQRLTATLAAKLDKPNLSESDARQRFVPLLTEIGAKKITLQRKQEGAAYQWLDKSRLRTRDYVIEFSELESYDSFRKNEDILNRFKVVGHELRRTIRPALIKAQAITLGIVFVLLAVVFTIFAIRYKKRVQLLIDGFQKWADSTQTYRFEGGWHGELGLIARQFNIMADEVERNKSIRMSLEKIASWQTIARKMAHEIKNPLTPIGLMVARLQKQYRGDDENYRKLLHDAHTIVGDEIRSLGRMVDNFSKFAQLPQANLMPADMVETAKQAWKLECERYASILFQPSVEQLTVEHDRAQIIQVLHNLIKNAAQASAATTITISIRKADAECVVEVIDNGPGIPQDIQTKIFDAYFTTKNTGPDPGMGLGLAICQKVAIEHKGKLIFESKLGHTVFRLILPLKQGSNS